MLIDAARGEGLDVMGDVYPYTASSTSLRTLLPDWALEGGVDAMLARLEDAAVRERESAYPWAAQVNLARRNGIREEVIEVIRAKADPRKLPEEERDVVVYARQLMRGNRVDQALNSAQTAAREMLRRVPHPAGGEPMAVVGNPVKMGGRTEDCIGPPPLLGQHTDEVLRDLLGYDENEIGALRAEGVI